MVKAKGTSPKIAILEKSSLRNTHATSEDSAPLHSNKFPQTLL